MVAITRQTSGLAILILLITIVLTIVRLVVNPFAAEVAVLPYSPKLWECMVSAVLLFATAVVVNRTAVKMGILGGFGTLPMSLFGFSACGILLSPQLLTASVAGLLAALGIMFLLKVMHLFGEKESIFTGSLFLGAAAVVYAPASVLGIAVLVAIFVAPLNIRQIILACVGWMIPIAATSYVNWYLGGSISDTVSDMWQHIVTPQPIPLSPLPIVTAIVTAMVAVMIVFSFIMSIHYRYTLVVSVRKSIEMEVWIAVICIAALFLPGCTITMLPVISVPVSVLLAFALERVSTTWANSLYAILIVLIILHLFVY